jgi:heat shock protein HtpX
MLRMTVFGHSRNSHDRETPGQFQILLAAAGFLLALLSPLVAQLIKLALSRRREYLADASAAAISKNPAGLISALQKLNQDKEPLEAANKATAHLYITNPLKNHHNAIGMFANLFQTHPPIEDRIARLQQLTV